MSLFLLVTRLSLSLVSVCHFASHFPLFTPPSLPPSLSPSLPTARPRAPLRARVGWVGTSNALCLLLRGKNLSMETRGELVLVFLLSLPCFTTT